MKKYVLIPSEHYERLLKDTGINQIESPFNGVASETSLKPTIDTALEDIKKTSVIRNQIIIHYRKKLLLTLIGIFTKRSHLRGPQNKS